MTLPLYVTEDSRLRLYRKRSVEVEDIKSKQGRDSKANFRFTAREGGKEADVDWWVLIELSN